VAGISRGNFMGGRNSTSQIQNSLRRRWSNRLLSTLVAKDILIKCISFDLQQSTHRKKTIAREKLV
jgi:hypothetical protein